MVRPYQPALNPSGKLNIWDVANRVNAILRGRLNNIADWTLTSASTTSILENPLITPESAIFVTPLTANAAAALVGSYWSSQTPGSATLTHTLNANVDLNVRVVIFG